MTLEERFSRGDKAAAAELLEHYMPQLSKCAKRRAPQNTTIAQDALDDFKQAILVMAETDSVRYDPTRSLKPFLFGILAKKLIDRLRQAGQRPTCFQIVKATFYELNILGVPGNVLDSLGKLTDTTFWSQKPFRSALENCLPNKDHWKFIDDIVRCSRHWARYRVDSSTLTSLLLDGVPEAVVEGLRPLIGAESQTGRSFKTAVRDILPAGTTEGLVEKICQCAVVRAKVVGPVLMEPMSASHTSDTGPEGNAHLIQQMRDCFGGLSNEQQKVLKLRFEKGMKLREISQEVFQSTDTNLAANKIRSALEKLKSCLIEKLAGGASEDNSRIGDQP